MAKKAKSKRAEKHDSTTWLIVAGIVALALLLFSRSNAAAATASGAASTQTYESGASHVTFFQPDPATGAPQFSSADALSVPPGTGLPAIVDSVSGAVIGAPSGYTLWRDQATGSYLYFPGAVSIA